jgi:pimeloyl-ACP methyl ester carboxylesterase
MRALATPFVLLHSPLVGPVTWEALAGAIRERGYEVTVPDLTDAVSDGPPYWPRQVKAIVERVVARPVILVAHSGAGPLLPAAGRALDRVEGYIFVDAGLPYPGRSWLETAPAELAEQLRAMTRDGWLPPWPEWFGTEVLTDLLPDPKVRARFVASCPPLPMAMFKETQPAVPGWPLAPCAYLRLSDAYQAQADQARSLGWPVAELGSHHLAVLTDAEAVVGPLLDLVGQLRR